MKILFAMILAVMVVQGADFSARDFGAKGVAPFDPKGEKQEGLNPIHTVYREI